MLLPLVLPEEERLSVCPLETLLRVELPLLRVEPELPLLRLEVVLLRRLVVFSLLRLEELRLELELPRPEPPRLEELLFLSELLFLL